MKILFIIFFFVVSITATAQTQQDTIDILRGKAKLYLTKMYAEKNFDTAFKMWSTKMQVSARDMYKENKILSNDSLLLTRIKSDFKQHSLHYSNFKLGEFLLEHLDNSTNQVYYTVSYIYTEKESGKPFQSSAICSLIFEPATSEWKVLESKGLAIMQELSKDE